MQWKDLLSLNKFGDTKKRSRKEQDESRLGFEVDYDRIIYSSAFRSLQDKTQVIPFSKTDFVHTRLTHSLEVSVVGRSLGRQAGKAILKKYPELQRLGYKMEDFGAIVAAACLAHDIGNPPFGHAGEKAIGQYFSTGEGKRFRKHLTEAEYLDLTHFEGNANGFKLLTETKHGIADGLRLTFATLGAFTKYPKSALPYRPDKGASSKKIGFFQDQSRRFREVAETLGLKHKNKKHNSYHRHPLAFLVEAADDICYSIIDFEDGINLGWIDENYALKYLKEVVDENIKEEKYKGLATKKARVGYLRSLAIGALVKDMTEVFVQNETSILNGNFDDSLKSHSRFTGHLNQIVQMSIKSIYRSPEVTNKEILGHRVLSTLLDAFTQSIERKQTQTETHLDNLILRNYLNEVEYENKTVYGYLINLCSYVAGLSDGNARRIYDKIRGVE